MNITTRKLPKSLMFFAPIRRALQSSFGMSQTVPPRPFSLEELSTHLQRDIGLMDGHATPERHAKRLTRL